MFLILFGDPRLVPQERVLFKSTMTYSGMQHINMTSTMLQDTRKGKLSFPNKLIQLMNLIMILVNTSYLIKKRMILPPTQFFNLLSILLNLKNLPRFLSLINSGESFLRLQGSLSLNTTRRLKWLTPDNISMVATLNINLLWLNLTQSPSKSTFKNDHSPDNPHPEDSTQAMVHECLTDGGIDPSNINTVMSAFKAKWKTISSFFKKIKVHQRYVFARTNQSSNRLVDNGANGGLAIADMRILQKTDRKINIVGIDNHELTGLDVVTAAALFDTQKGPVIGIFHEYAHLSKGTSIHVAEQMEWINCKVDDRSKVVGGSQALHLGSYW